HEAAGAFTPPPVLDAWGNPIIYVPGGDPNANPPSGGLKVYVTGNNGAPELRIIRSPDNRAFWASAGPDGIFNYADSNHNNQLDVATETIGGDDNVYSFEQ